MVGGVTVSNPDDIQTLDSAVEPSSLFGNRKLYNIHTYFLRVEFPSRSPVCRRRYDKNTIITKKCSYSVPSQYSLIKKICIHHHRKRDNVNKTLSIFLNE